MKVNIRVCETMERKWAIDPGHWGGMRGAKWKYVLFVIQLHRDERRMIFVGSGQVPSTIRLIEGTKKDAEIRMPKMQRRIG